MKILEWFYLLNYRNAEKLGWGGVKVADSNARSYTVVSLGLLLTFPTSIALNFIYDLSLIKSPHIIVLIVSYVLALFLTWYFILRKKHYVSIIKPNVKIAWYFWVIYIGINLLCILSFVCSMSFLFDLKKVNC